MIIYLVLGAITALLCRSLLKTWRRCYKTYYQYPGRAQATGLTIAAILLVIASLGCLFMGLTLASALLSHLNPSSPAPYVLLPWGIGLVVAGIPSWAAEVIINWIRKDERLNV